MQHRDSPLPAPEADALAHSLRLTEHIAEQVRAGGGSISFARYMELALYTPGAGYYSAGLAKLGEAGDFVTAPEISPLFGRCVARQIGQILGSVGGREVLEVGAGTGRLAADVLLALQAGEGAHGPPERYLILERSADLRERQARTLRERLDAALAERVAWLDELPARVHGVVVANEVLDALPVHLLEVGRDGLLERRVAWDGALRWRSVPAGATLRARFEAVTAALDRPLPPGYRCELGLAVPAWVSELGQRLADGALLLFDYGYPRRELYHPQRGAGTLRCHYRHRAHDDPLLWPGLQDISAHVDFSSVAEAGRAAGLEIAGFTTQAAFLIGAGLLEVAAEEVPGSRAHAALTQAMKRLVLPGEMGEAVKVIALARGDLPALAGFSEVDHRPRL